MAQSKRRFVDYRVLFQAVTVKVLFQAVTVKGIVPSSHCQGYYSKQSLSRVLFQAVTVKGIIPSSHYQGYYSKQSLSRVLFQAVTVKAIYDRRWWTVSSWSQVQSHFKFRSRHFTWTFNVWKHTGYYFRPLKLALKSYILHCPTTYLYVLYDSWINIESNILDVSHISNCVDKATAGQTWLCL